ncbi:three prime repair exonuclease 2 [Hyperolius riggenbachi]|uniref:three prime repair exonuclease 2 n=1 Tax=Hyperolius riggenbachi TaxID=752182 RepID=UPI0035A3916B
MESLVKTYIFIDLEATGLNRDQPKITELCMVAVHAISINNPVTDESGEVQLPRVMDKLCLCVDPGKPLTKTASEITGLTNDLLTDCEKQTFDQNLFNTMSEFISRQAQPVCLVAHNGFFYDYPLLKTELLRQQLDLSESILCLDSLQAFRNLQNQGQVHPESGRKACSLTELYRQLFSKDPNFAHYAEGDVLTLILVFICKAEKLLQVAKYRRWGEIVPMY